MSHNPISMKFASLIKNNQLIEARNYLKKHNINVNSRPTLYDCIIVSYAKNSDVEILRFLLEEQYGNIIALTGNKDLPTIAFKIYKFINQGFNPQRLFDICFTFGCSEGLLDIAQFGFLNKANIHAQNDFALELSCINNQVDSIIYLLNKGIKITEKELLISSMNYSYFYMTSLSKNKEFDLLKFLLKNVHFPNLFDCSDELIENLIGKNLSYSPFSVSQDIHDILVDLAFNHKVPYTKKIKELLAPNKELTNLFSKKELFIKLNDNLIKDNNNNLIAKI